MNKDTGRKICTVHNQESQKDFFHLIFYDQEQNDTEKILRKLLKEKGKQQGLSKLNLRWIIWYKEHFTIPKTLGQTKKIESVQMIQSLVNS